MPNQPIFSEARASRSHFCFCSFEAVDVDEPIAKAESTPTERRNDGSYAGNLN